jgi:hypothetical protein
MVYSTKRVHRRETGGMVQPWLIKPDLIRTSADKLVCLSLHVAASSVMPELT